MKTPREILLAQHRAAESRLDKIRGELVAELNHKGTKVRSPISSFVSWCLGGSSAVWRELIFPSRRIWASLAAVWILILAVNFAQRDHSPVVMAKTAPTQEMILSFRQQEKLLGELIGQSEPRIAEPPKIFLPAPRSERIKIVAV